jgi:hypothetical protein
MTGTIRPFSAAAALAFAFLLVSASVCRANPIPAKYGVGMSSEDINIYVYPSRTLVEGIYTFERMGEGAPIAIPMFYPLPPNAEKIGVSYVKNDGSEEEVEWKRSSLKYETAIGEYGVIEWTIRDFPAVKFPFKVAVRYEYELPRQNETHIMLYAMGSVKLTGQLNTSNLVYSKGCRVSLNTYFPREPEELEACLLWVDWAPVSGGKWQIRQGEMDVLLHESKWVGSMFVVSTELALDLLTMGSDYAVQFKPTWERFAWIENLSADKNVYKPGENVTLDVAVKRGSDLLTVVYEAEVRYYLIVDGRDMGLLGSSRVEIPSQNGRAATASTCTLPDKLNGTATVQAELWSWNASLEDVKEIDVEIVGEPEGGGLPTWFSVLIAAAAMVAAIAIIKIAREAQLRLALE